MSDSIADGQEPLSTGPHETTSSRRGSAAGLAAAVLRPVPNAAVLVVLAGLGYWGHATGWKVPKFSELIGAAQAAPADWCAEHGVPESRCVECNRKEFPRPHDYGWCKEHGVHNCVLHHPDVAHVKEAVPITQADLERADRALKLRPRPENNLACKNPGRRIQFVAHESALKAGVDVEPVERARIVEAVSVTGEIRYDETCVARLSSKEPGTVWRVDQQIGGAVHRGEVVALIDAVEVGRLKAQFLAALAQEKLQQQVLSRLQGLADQGVLPGRQLQEAEAELTRARTDVLRSQQALINLGLPVALDPLRSLPEHQLAQQLQFLGLPKTITEGLDPATTTSNLLPLTSPLEGVVATRNVVAGEVVDTARVLLEIVDTRNMWLILNVPFEEVQYLRIGQAVHFQPDDAASDVTGQIAWISTTADPQTRTVQVRADLPNSDGRLHDKTFGVGRIILREENEAIVVPNSALAWDGSCHVVFVRDKDYFDKATPKVFHTRSVRPGAKTDQFTEIIAGVLPGEVVATAGSDVLRAQLLRNNLGAG